MSDLQKRIGKIIWDLKCPSNYNGLTYLIDAICIALESGNGIFCLRKVIYEKIAKLHNTDIRNVERCIRHFISKWWAENCCGGLFPECPTNGQLIWHLVGYVRVHDGKKVNFEDIVRGIAYAV